MIVSCRQYDELAAAHVDGALTPEELAAVEAHLAGCRRCERLRETQAAVKSTLQRPGLRERAPQDLAARIANAIEQEHGAASRSRGRSWTRLALLVGGMAAGVALVLLPRRLKPPADLLAVLSLDVRAANADDRPLAVRTSDLAELERYYHDVENVPFDATVADLSKAGFRAEGGAVGRIGDVVTTFTPYRRGAELILCRRFALGALPMPAGGEPFATGRMYSTDGVSVWIHDDRDATCCLATTMPRDRFVRDLQACGDHG